MLSQQLATSLVKFGLDPAELRSIEKYDFMRQNAVDRLIDVYNYTAYIVKDFQYYQYQLFKGSEITPEIVLTRLDRSEFEIEAEIAYVIALKTTFRTKNQKIQSTQMQAIAEHPFMLRKAVKELRQIYTITALVVRKLRKHLPLRHTEQEIWDLIDRRELQSEVEENYARIEQRFFGLESVDSP